MSCSRSAELVLGTAQLGLTYGIVNRTGKPADPAGLRLVRRAVHGGIRTFDTARAYGDSEARIGKALSGSCAIRTVTKLSALTELGPAATRGQVMAAVDRSISESMMALKRGPLDCLLLHRAGHMTAFNGAIWRRLLQLMEDGTVLSLGVSVQSPAEALAALSRNEVRHIQLPFNILDWRWKQSDVIERLRAREQLTVHVRSVFLQGLLSTLEPSLWPSVPDVNAEQICCAIASLTRELQRSSAADLCLAYARGQDWIDGIVIGMETEDQLDSNLALFQRPPLRPEECGEVCKRLPKAPEQLLDPALWPART